MVMDKWENIELFGGPNLRVFVPGDELQQYQPMGTARDNTIAVYRGHLS
jgi:hypothetical protein